MSWLIQILRKAKRRLNGTVPAPANRSLDAPLIRLLYPDLIRRADRGVEINRYEARLHSQNGEDGILLFLFTRIGTAGCRFVEFGVGDGRECNSANLSLNLGWTGLLMDGGRENVITGRRYYAQRLGEDQAAVKIVEAWITRENINQLISDAGMTGEIDLLSVDIDGNDYWVWKEINVVNPRVVVVEYNASFGKTDSVTIPYNASFVRRRAHTSGFYHGASLRALVNLGKTKGYRFVGCDSFGINAFFVREDLAAAAQLSAVDPDVAYFPAGSRTHLGSLDEQYATVIHLERVKV